MRSRRVTTCPQPAGYTTYRRRRNALAWQIYISHGTAASPAGPSLATSAAWPTTSGPLRDRVRPPAAYRDHRVASVRLDVRRRPERQLGAIPGRLAGPPAQRQALRHPHGRDRPSGGHRPRPSARGDRSGGEPSHAAGHRRDHSRAATSTVTRCARTPGRAQRPAPDPTSHRPHQGPRSPTQSSYDGASPAPSWTGSPVLETMAETVFSSVG